MRTHLPGTDAVFRMTYRSIAGVLVDPTAQTWNVWDNTQTLVDSFSQSSGQVSQESTGKWLLTYAIPADATGVWTVEAKGTATYVMADRIQIRIC